MTKEKILIALPSSSGLVRTEFLQNYTAINTSLVSAGYQVGVALINRSFIDNARNMFLDMARNDDCDYLFFIDDDTMIEPRGVIRMIEADKDIISPPVSDRKGTDWVNVYNLNGKPIKKEDIKETMQVGGIGMACTLIKRKVLDSMAKEFLTPFEFQTATNAEGKKFKLSEDLGFCYRAFQKFGYETWVIKGVWTKHIGEPNFYGYEG